MKRHKLLSGESIGLADVEARDVAFLRNLQRMAASGISFFEVERVAIGPGSPALRGWSRVTPEIVRSPLYRVAADIATRAGIAEGLILAPEHEDERSQIPTDRSLMSVTQAATALGISRAAVHKAIQQKRLTAQRYGNVLLVKREAVLHYKRQRAGRSRISSNAQAPAAAGACRTRMSASVGRPAATLDTTSARYFLSVSSWEAVCSCCCGGASAVWTRPVASRSSGLVVSRR